MSHFRWTCRVIGGLNVLAAFIVYPLGLGIVGSTGFDVTQNFNDLLTSGRLVNADDVSGADLFSAGRLDRHTFAIFSSIAIGLLVQGCACSLCRSSRRAVASGHQRMTAPDIALKRPCTRAVSCTSCRANTCSGAPLP